MSERSLDKTTFKRIALSPRLVENESYHEIREAVDIQWGRFLLESGAVPFVLPTSLNKEHLASLPIDGIVLTGGNDLNRLSPNPLSEQRDAFETRLVEYGIEHGIPIFGVCRGFQFLASYFGAELKKIEGHIAVRHQLVNEFYGLSDVNSYHSWGVFELPACLEEQTQTADGSIEAFRHRELPISAVLWHPEREIPFQKWEQPWW